MTTRAIRLKTTLPLVVAASLLFLQVFSPTPATKFVLWALIGTIAVSYGWVRIMARGVIVRRQRRHGWAQVGDLLEERFVMHNHSWVPVPWAEVRDYSNLPGYSAGRALSLAPRRFTRWEKRVLCTQRGVFTLGPMEVLMGDPFGLFETSVRLNVSETFVVFPAIVPLPPLIEPRGISRGSGTANLVSMDQTTNATSVRLYVPGDPLRRIHWRTTAKRSTPTQNDVYVREFDIEPSGDVWIILDLEAGVHIGEGPASTEEYAVVLAASLTDRLLNAQHAVGLVAYVEEPIVLWPQKGRHQLYEMLRMLAGLHAVGDVAYGQVLKLTESVVGRGMTAVLITPSTEPEWVTAVPNLLLRGVHPTTLLLDARSFGGQNGSIQATVRSLADVGVRTQLIDRSLKLEEMATRQPEEASVRTRGLAPRPDRSPQRRLGPQWMPLGQE